mmetsp:Transcript_47630/g.126303  ORF Transcript_47630/g.126303 Transcript_47630/m.126303 type:complete len:125 (+) Transcript_47630:117-491(+)|eukprot:CAMPEP_0113687524 /NCGR_PEP_ID=MMETSP0038_2-20120614/15985_1 /TAXON_ID=2898 /ORGANISM="Cryptomonas paramecium" /LENGTH=124 /DNA_ID=CAMNT_0000608151 /DNA_START=60 /DNA_END=434 /DNA_ORIENTATION=+ /assembly_acc=CAM_ASM_000170
MQHEVAMIRGNDGPVSMKCDDWKSFAQEIWGIEIDAWNPAPGRYNLPDGVEYDTLNEALIEMSQSERYEVLQSLSLYQAGKISQRVLVQTLKKFETTSKAMVQLVAASEQALSNIPTSPTLKYH